MIVKKDNRSNILELTPKQLYPYERVEKGKIVVLVPQYERTYTAWIIPKTNITHLRFNLDLLGSSVWDSINGRKTVRQIADQMKSEYGRFAEPIDERVTKFVRRLHDESLIDIGSLGEEKIHFSTSKRN